MYMCIYIYNFTLYYNRICKNQIYTYIQKVFHFIINKSSSSGVTPDNVFIYVCVC